MIVVQILAIKSSKGLVSIDKKSWVCSVDLQSAVANEASKYCRHFFVPHERIAESRHVVCFASA